MRRNNSNSILYEKIMRNISREVKRVLNEKDYYVDDYNYDSAVTITGKQQSKIVVKNNDELSAIIKKRYEKNKNGVLDLRDIDVSHVTKFSELFNYTGVRVIDITGWNTSKAKYMTDMFFGCKHLTEIRGIENLNTSNVIIMKGMFYNCSSLKELDLSNWDISNVESITYMFKNCSKLQELDLSNWDTRHVADTSYMFHGCEYLTEIKGIEKLDTSNVIMMSGMFYGCSSLKELDLSTWDVSNVEYMSYMFRNCSGLQELNLSNWDIRHVENTQDIFHNVNKKIIISKNIKK